MPHLAKKNNALLTFFAFISCANALPMSKTFANTTADLKNVEVIEVLNNHDFARSNYEVLRREDFIDTSQSLSDVLGQVNGIQIKQISGIGNPVSISIRGSSAKQVQFFIDGQLVNDSQFGSFDLNQIPTEQIESIEISKNQAIGTGSTPIGGVIRINTYNPSEDTYKISVAAGSFGYKELNLLNNSAFKYHNLAMGANYLTSDNNYDYTYQPPGSSEFITEPLKNDEFEKMSFFINDMAQFGQHQLRVNLTYIKQEKGLPNYQFNAAENTSNIEMDSVRYGFQYNWISTVKAIDTLELEYYFDSKNELYLDNLLQAKIITNDYQTDKQHIGLKPNFTLNSFTVSPYVSATAQKFTSLSTSNGAPTNCSGVSACDIEATQSHINMGARLAWQSESLPLYTYVLANQLREESTNIALNHLGASKEHNDESYNTQELGFSLGDKTLNASLNWSNGVRTPTLYELFGDRGAFKGNDNLKPEESKTYALSIKYQDKISTTPFNLSSSVYQQTIDNAIVAIFNPSGTGSYNNVSHAKIVGFELQGGSQITSSLSLSVQAHIIDSDNQSIYKAFDNKKLPGIYHQQYSAALNYQFFENWQLKVSSSIDKDLYFNRSNQIEEKPEIGKTGNPANRMLTDLSLHWSTNKYRINLLCSNVFDQQFKDLANRPAEGRSIQLKFSIEDI